MTGAAAAADALGSVRAEGLDLGRAEPILAAGARGELTDAQLEQVGRRLLHERELTAPHCRPASAARNRIPGRIRCPATANGGEVGLALACSRVAWRLAGKKWQQR